jgi:hypothetical protein
MMRQPVWSTACAIVIKHVIINLIMSVSGSEPGRFEEIVGSPELAELSVITIPIPPWCEAADLANTTPHAAEARTVCASLLQGARTESILFEHQLLRLYYFLLEKKDRALATRPTSPFEIANFLTTSLPNPADLMTFIGRMHEPKRQELVDARNRRYIETPISATAPLDIQQKYDQNMAHARADLDPSARATANEAVMRTLYGKRYMAFVKLENPEA